MASSRTAGGETELDDAYDAEEKRAELLGSNESGE